MPGAILGAGGKNLNSLLSLNNQVPINELA